MKSSNLYRIRFQFGIFFILLCCLGCNQEIPERKVKHAILIGLDAFGSRGFQKAETPHLNQMVAEGAIAPFARAVLPTNSSPNWTSMLTGADPLQHGVYDNDWELDNQRWPPVIATEKGVYPSLFNWINDQLPESNMHFFYEWGGLARLYDLEGVDKVFHGDTGDEVFTNAVNAFFEERPDFLFIDIDEIDHYGHQDGHDSKSYFQSISHYDSLIGNFVEKLKDAGLMEETLILITGDHGGIGKGHGGNSLEELEIPIILFGKGVQKGRVVAKPCYQYDVAPTLAYALGIKPPDAGVGRPILEAFDPKAKSGTFVPMPVISPASGFYKQKELILEISADSPRAEIWYTLDGTPPSTDNGKKYEGPFPISENSLVTAVTWLENQSSRQEIQQYRISNEEGKVNWKYVEGTFTQVPDFDNLSVITSGKSSEISLDEIPHRADHFALHYTANLVIPKSGTYTFFLESDDGSLLFLNGEKVIDNDGSHSTREKNASLDLEAGIFPLEVYYFDDIAGEALEVSFVGPGIPKQIITTDFLK
ncbi:alkaline phosphatase family protein [Cyclobacterium jeungdonense]|uniref:Alkaline phosphatase family protein n=1 Tax=Cyclobacterium jeungdonense TaxID=708087 RepID=A0ABT8CC24_9BACT|nr:alkaline phosphatase family protein [Cyclobacterium jeungdonense]MDN3689931.1 alkaline phosphatase family protein [Cyclobacterium jeungdonense]